VISGGRRQAHGDLESRSVQWAAGEEALGGSTLRNSGTIATAIAKQIAITTACH
jgi:hypothetical protein